MAYVFETVNFISRNEWHWYLSNPNQLCVSVVVCASKMLNKNVQTKVQFKSMFQFADGWWQDVSHHTYANCSIPKKVFQDEMQKNDMFLVLFCENWLKTFIFKHYNMTVSDDVHSEDFSFCEHLKWQAHTQPAEKCKLWVNTEFWKPHSLGGPLINKCAFVSLIASLAYFISFFTTSMICQIQAI